MRPDGALVDLAQVVQKQHELAQKANEPCSGIIYVHKRDDCAYLAARLSKVSSQLAPLLSNMHSDSRFFYLISSMQ